MRSVADDLRRDTTRLALRLTAGERIARALRLGDDDLVIYGRRSGDQAASRRALQRTREAGRLPSRANGFDRP